jgi:pyruvate formate lyase activating enzyme
LFDIKHTDDNAHKKHTGVSNKSILENLLKLDKSGAKIILRCPVIPGVNMTYEHFEKVALLAEKHSGVCAIDLEPYHPLGKDKSRQLGKEQQYDRSEFLDKKEVQPFAEFLRTKTSVDVRIQ